MTDETEQAEKPYVVARVSLADKAGKITHTVLDDGRIAGKGTREPWKSPSDRSRKATPPPRDSVPHDCGVWRRVGDTHIALDADTPQARDVVRRMLHALPWEWLTGHGSVLSHVWIPVNVAEGARRIGGNTMGVPWQEHDETTGEVRVVMKRHCESRQGANLCAWEGTWHPKDRQPYYVKTAAETPPPQDQETVHALGYMIGAALAIAQVTSQGSRHHAALAISGMCRRLGFPFAWPEALLQALPWQGGDDGLTNEVIGSTYKSPMTQLTSWETFAGFFPGPGAHRPRYSVLRGMRSSSLLEHIASAGHDDGVIDVINTALGNLRNDTASDGVCVSPLGMSGVIGGLEHLQRDASGQDGKPPTKGQRVAAVAAWLHARSRGVRVDAVSRESYVPGMSPTATTREIVRVAAGVGVVMPDADARAALGAASTRSVRAAQSGLAWVEESWVADVLEGMAASPTSTDAGPPARAWGHEVARHIARIVWGSVSGHPMNGVCVHVPSMQQLTQMVQQITLALNPLSRRLEYRHGALSFRVDDGAAYSRALEAVMRARGDNAGHAVCSIVYGSEVRTGHALSQLESAGAIVITCDASLQSQSVVARPASVDAPQSEWASYVAREALAHRGHA